MNRRELLLAGAAACLYSQTARTEAQPANKADLNNKTILITGASSGFGRLGAEHYARLGAKVIASMRNMPRPEAEALSALAAKDNLDLHVVEIDVLDEESVTRGVNEAIEICGGVPDVLINNAGIAIVGPVEAQDETATKLAYDTNVFGYQRMQRAVLPLMRHRGSGHIINLSSQSGRVIWPGLGHYCPTKFAIEAMSESLAYELSSFGVEVTLIQPGGYPTELWNTREKLTADLKARSEAKYLEGYGEMADNMGSGNIPNLQGDLMDVPKAIASAIAAPSGKKPMRVMVSASGHPQSSINSENRETHLKLLGRGPYKDAVRSVQD
ncbi:SDR family oxidoreductase [Algisphaera agarilytica]|uniref:NAD(P)-dependent dehydrogenase (Short-subunit alcohol dehydrogenase family) n=1 Tax=Algisphaera agarilytica TaxID=1385975 RepID=A0A7X0H504_9BACT|nr:SDR family oxidoreductase [Algisphaera agarilytica]MBB6429142.1 NAD(P)-dependent dehydrogenase (short-subunit alcohol dehydrogenase family) [Algisphaera agarilytica]